MLLLRSLRPHARRLQASQIEHNIQGRRDTEGAVQLKLAAVEGPSILQLLLTEFEERIQALTLELAFAAEASNVVRARRDHGRQKRQGAARTRAGLRRSTDQGSDVH
jgi:hypothetical protein